MIRLQFSTENRIGSMFIRTYSHSEYSHVDAIVNCSLDDTINTDHLIGSRFFGGVQIRKMNYANFSKKLIVSLPVDKDMESQFNTFMFFQVNKKYDWGAYSSFLMNRDWKQKNRWHCSELIAAALENVGYFKNKLILPSERIDPGDLLLLLSEMTTI